MPVSAGLLVDTDVYFVALSDYRAGNPAAIGERLPHAAFRSVANWRQLVDGLRSVEAHILTKVSGSHRNRKWAASEVFVALDAFADRAGRRVAGG